MSKHKTRQQVKSIDESVEERRAFREFLKGNSPYKHLTSLFPHSCDGNCNDCTEYECEIKNINL